MLSTSFGTDICRQSKPCPVLYFIKYALLLYNAFSDWHHMVPLWWPELWDEVWLLDLHGIQGVHCKHRQTDRQTNTDKYTKHPGLTQGVQKAMVITKTNIPYSAFSKQNIWFSIWQFLFPHSWIWCWTQRREGTSVGSCQMVRVKASRQSKLHKIMISWTTYQISLHSITCISWKFHLHHNWS